MLPEVQAQRNELGDFWTVKVDIVIERCRAGIAVGENPNFDEISQLAATCEKHHEFGEALSAWCRARDAVPTDEAALARALDQATESLSKLKAELEGRGFDPLKIQDKVSIQAQLIRLIGEGCLRHLADEAKMIMAGERIPRSGPSEGMLQLLSTQTADREFQKRIGGNGTWGAVGKTLRGAIGEKTAASDITRKIGKIDLDGAARRLASLDSALEKRKQAQAPVDYVVRSDVHTGYLDVIDALGQQLRKLRDAAGAGPGGRGEWSPEKLREVTDMVVLTMRCVEAELAADPLVEDPDLAASARATLSKIGPMAGATSTEAEAQTRGLDLRKLWQDAKKTELAALKRAGVDTKRAGVDTKKLSKAFDAGLGPTLDAWEREVAKFPRHDRATLKKLTVEASKSLASYRAAVQAAAGPNRSSGLLRALDVVSAAMTCRVAAFDARGGLF